MYEFKAILSSKDFKNIPQILKLKSYYFSSIQWASIVAQLVKNLPAMRETLVQFLGWEDPLEKGKAPHFSILAWRIPMDRGTWHATVHGVAKSQTRLND